jgi:hypothetical protein
VIRVNTWYGGKKGHRFGPKQFATLIATTASPRDLLGRIAKALLRVMCPASRGRPWRPLQETVPAAIGRDALSFFADGRYSWSGGSPRLGMDPTGGVTLTTALQGAPRGGGQECVQLECTAMPSRRKPQVGIVLEFTEGTVPMWLHREGEALVACTVLQLGQALEQQFGAPIAWHFRRGDWTNLGQLVQIPGHGVFVLTSGR